MKPYQQTQARELYLQGGLTQQQIASLLDINRKTVGLWIQQGQWRQMRIAAQQTPAMLLQDFYNQLAVLNETIHQRGGIPTIEESIVQRRLIMNIKSFDRQPTSNYIQLYTELINEISKQDPELGKKVTLHADSLISQKSKNKNIYHLQDMFLTDDLEEDNDANTYDHIQTDCHTEPGSEATDNHIEQSPCDKNETFCDIPQNTNIIDNQDLQPQEPPKPPEENNTDNETIAYNHNYTATLSNGIIWLGDGMVYDPAISKKREITHHELTQFRNLTPPPPDLTTW